MRINMSLLIFAIKILHLVQGNGQTSYLKGDLFNSIFGKPVECENSDSEKRLISPLEVCQQTCGHLHIECIGKSNKEIASHRFVCRCPEQPCPKRNFTFVHEGGAKSNNMKGMCVEGSKAKLHCSEYGNVYCQIYHVEQPLSVAYCVKCKPITITTTPPPSSASDTDISL